MRRAGIAIASVFGAGVVAVVIGVVVLIVIAVNSLSGAARSSVADTAPTCPDVATRTVHGIVVPAGPVGGFCQDRLVNAAAVIAAAQALGIGPHTQAVGVMTAIGESSLVNLDHGDAAGPDSRGLFQQRDNGAWGTYEQRMDPYTAASMFYAKLVKIPGWKTLTPTQMAHAVQINSDPDHYAKFWPEAKAVVEGLTGETVPDTAPQG
uniref:Peptidase M23 n=1 Tax=Neobacillus citreus TaxID=2833578 RepID=A0A942YBF5_9BACI